MHDADAEKASASFGGVIWPAQVIITGRGCHRDILELADTVSELRPVKHAFDAGVKAQIGIDY